MKNMDYGKNAEQVNSFLYSLKCDKIVPQNATLNDVNVAIIRLNNEVQKKHHDYEKIKSENAYLKENAEDLELINETNRNL